MELLAAWVGNSDLKAAEDDTAAVQGPIATAVAARPPDEVLLLSSHAAARGEGYAAWLRRHRRVRVTLRSTSLRSPTDFGDIHEAACRALTEVLARHGRRARLGFLLSGGTPAMAAVFLLLGKTRYPATFFEASRDYGVREVEVPFSLSAEFLPDLLRAPDAALERLSSELPPPAPEWAQLVHRCAPMKRLVARARRVAMRSVPVLIEGESGTGKELLARAIHRSGPRAEGPFVAVNCGAIPAPLVEAELFGHEKGAFTGAARARAGHFREAHGGTLFLDEIGELPSDAQVKLLRSLQQGEVLAVGSSRPVRVEARIVAATNRNLIREVAAGRFRSDLYYRLAVAILALPPLREREGDLDLLLDHAMAQINGEVAADPGYEPKRLAPAARSVLHAHAWPGNVRELFNTLRRAALWSAGASIGAEEAREALQPDPRDAVVAGGDVDLPTLMAELARRHLERALAESGGNKSRAAARLGLRSHQTFSNWMRRYGGE